MAGFSTVRPAHGRLERLLDRAVDYYWWADRFGWTPDQVDAQPYLRRERIRTVAEVVDEVRRDKDRSERGR